MNANTRPRRILSYCTIAVVLAANVIVELLVPALQMLWPFPLTVALDEAMFTGYNSCPVPGEPGSVSVSDEPFRMIVLSEVVAVSFAVTVRTWELRPAEKDGTLWRQVK